jgi:hypothetical protein
MSNEEAPVITRQRPVPSSTLGLIAILAVFAAAGQKASGGPQTREADLRPFETRLLLPPPVEGRIAWAREALVPSGLAKLERLALATAPAIASGTDFAAVRKRTELDLVAACPGLAGMDVSEAAFIVMGMATKNMDDDLRTIMAEIHAMNAAKQKLRDQIKDLNEWISEEMSGAKEGTKPSDINSGGVPGKSRQAPRKPPAKALPSRSLTLDKVLSPVIRLEYVKAPAVPPLPPKRSGISLDGLRSLRDELKGRLDGMNEMSEMTSLRLQMTMDRRSKFISTLSNIMKKTSTTQDILVQNIK